MNGNLPKTPPEEAAYPNKEGIREPDLSLFTKSPECYGQYVDIYVSLLAEQEDKATALAISCLVAGSWGLLARGIESLPVIRSRLNGRDKLLTQTLGFVARRITHEPTFPERFVQLYHSSCTYRESVKNLALIDDFTPRVRDKVLGLLDGVR